MSTSARILTRATTLSRTRLRATPAPPVAAIRSFASSAPAFAPKDTYNLDLGTTRKRLPINTGIVFVPQAEAFIVERMGKFHSVLEPGLNFLIPGLDRIAYVKSLKEQPHDISGQTCITSDNVSLRLDAVLYTRIVDPYKASYGVERVSQAVAQLAQTTMRSEIGKLTLDRTLSERAFLNTAITEAINTASSDWGIVVLRCEIRDITPPTSVVEAMHQQVSAERSKRAQILQAEALKQSQILSSEARQAEQVNLARGEAQATVLRADAAAEALRRVAAAIQAEGGREAVGLQVAERYVDAFAEVAREGNTLLLPGATPGDLASLMSQAMSIYKTVSPPSSPSSPSSPTPQSAPSPSSPLPPSPASDNRDSYEARYAELASHIGHAGNPVNPVTPGGA